MKVVQIVLGLILLVAGPTLAQDSESEDVGQQNQDSEQPAVASIKPFTAYLSIDGSPPLVYGDDVVLSVLITPQQDMDLVRVSVLPKGNLEAVYGNANANPEGGTTCPLGVLARPAGPSFLVNCRLSGKRLGRKWSWNSAVLEAQKAQIQVEIVLQSGQEHISYYEHVDVDFVSPRSYVIVGGLCGALLWAVFLALSANPPRKRRVRVENWRALGWRFVAAAPDTLARGAGGTLRLLNRAALGGLTALVLIVLAKGTDGFEPPISLRIQDFWGGLMIGILSTPLARWLRDRVAKFSDERANETENKP